MKCLIAAAAVVLLAGCEVEQSSQQNTGFEADAADLTRLIDSDPEPESDGDAALYITRAEAHSSRATVHKQRGEDALAEDASQEALADYEAAIRLQPEYAELFRARGEHYQRQGDLEKAIADFSEAIRLEPENSLYYSTRGTAYRELGNAEKGREDWAEAMRLFESSRRE